MKVETKENENETKHKIELHHTHDDRKNIFIAGKAITMSLINIK